MEENKRKMATIRVIDDIQPIEGADKIVCATVGGWKLVTAIDNGFNVGDSVIYCEVDSWIPHDVAPFLCRGPYPRVYNGVGGERLKTIKLRGQVSQGLLLPISVLPRNKFFNEGDDVSDVLGIQKWEAPENPQLAGIRRGSFPHYIRKTNQERIQNMTKDIEKFKKKCLTFEVSEKLEGSSMTVYKFGNEFGVCSRNINLKETDGNKFWQIARELDIEKMLNNYGKDIAIQGELIGEGIQGNHYNIKGHEFRVFDVWDITKQEYYNAAERSDLVCYLNLSEVPLISLYIFDELDTMEGLIKFSDDYSELGDMKREGLVFKCISDPSISFKIISNEYLLKKDKKT